MRSHIAAALFLLTLFGAAAQTSEENQVRERLNLSFERVEEGQPAHWISSELTRPYSVTITHAQAHEGERSVAFRCAVTECEEDNFGVVAQRISATPFAGQTLRYAGYLKTEEVEAGYAGLWLRVDGEVAGRSEVLAFDAMNDRGVTGTSGWQRYEVVLEVPEGAQTLSFGAHFTGKGRAWADHLALTITDDDTQQEASIIDLLTLEAFVKTGADTRLETSAADLLTFQPAEEAYAPAEVLAWLREHMIPLETAAPITYDEDLVPLKEMIGDARVVALGEATHGASEFFTLKHRLVQFLAEEMNFTVFSIEANMPEAYRVNQYVLTGEGDPKELLRGIHNLSIWNTQEVLDLILWMREYNASGRGVMQFTGFDMQTPTVAMKEVRAFVETHDPTYLAQLDCAYKVVENVFSLRGGQDAEARDLRAWRDAARAVLTQLTNNRAVYSDASPSERAWAVQNARIVLQGAEYKLARSGASRDRSMAANVMWILAQHPEAKVVLWAHNAHIKEWGRETYMGERLSDTLRNDYFSLGFAFYEGEFQAVPRGGGTPRPHTASAASARSVEGVFHTLNAPLFALDLRLAQREAPWLALPQDTRTGIGWIANDYQLSFSKRQLPREYDAIIFVDQMTPTDLLR